MSPTAPPEDLAARLEKRLADWMPLLRDLRHYRREWLTRDVVAGLSVTAVQVPTAIAYATLAGSPMRKRSQGRPEAGQGRGREHEGRA